MHIFQELLIVFQNLPYPQGCMRENVVVYVVQCFLSVVHSVLFNEYNVFEKSCLSFPNNSHYSQFESAFHENTTFKMYRYCSINGEV